MKSYFSLLLLALSVLFTVSCSKNLAFVSEPETGNELVHPTTKALNNGLQKYSYYQLIHSAQASHIGMLVNNVFYKDGVYQQGLSKKDMETLGITEEEQAFGREYLDILNKQPK